MCLNLEGVMISFLGMHPLVPAINTPSLLVEEKLSRNFNFSNSIEKTNYFPFVEEVLLEAKEEQSRNRERKKQKQGEAWLSTSIYFPFSFPIACLLSII